MSEDFATLGQGAGYGIIVGLGMLFGVGMVFITSFLKRYNREIITAEEFSTAGRSLKKFLISAAVVSSWTWAATLLTSTAQVYKNGVSGGFFYASGATVQIILFSCLGIKIKQRAPNAHTFLEVIKARYGRATHIVYCVWGIFTNILVTAMLLAGASATFKDLTGVHLVASCLLIPLGVVIYTMFGGLKATIISDWIHGSMVIIIALVFAFTAFATHHIIGSPGKVWELVNEATKENPIAGNAGGSLLTMHSRSGGIFFVINIVGNFGTIFLDTAYLSKLLAARSDAAMPGYIYGALAWFSIPFFVSLTMGLSARALIPGGMNPTDVSAGLVLPNAAVKLLGTGGGVASLIIVFTAATSAMSSELVAVSSIITFDVYRGYINPTASGKKLIFVSHMTIIIFAYVMACFAIGLAYSGVNMGWLYEFMGVIIGGGVLSSALCILSSKQNRMAAMLTPPIATALAIMSWLVVAGKKFGAVNVDTTFEDDAMLTGNVVALLTPLIIIPVLTYAFGPQNFDWKILEQKITRVDEEEELVEAEHLQYEDSEKGVNPVTSQVSRVASEIAAVNKPKYVEDQAKLAKGFKYNAALCVFLTIALLVLWPMPMYGAKYVFSKRFFTGWVVVGFIWMFIALFITVIGPVWESRESIYFTCRGIYWDCTGQSHKLKEWQNSNPEKLHAVQSQVHAQLSALLSKEIVEGRNIDDYLSNEDLDKKEKSSN